MLWLCFFNFCPFCGKRMPCQFWVIWCLRCRRWPAKAPIEISILRHTTCATKVLQSLPWRAFISDPDPTRSEILHHSERPNWTAKMPLTYEAMPASSCKSQAVLLFNILCHEMSWLALLKFVNPLWVKSHGWSFFSVLKLHDIAITWNKQIWSNMIGQTQDRPP